MRVCEEGVFAVLSSLATGVHARVRVGVYAGKKCVYVCVNTEAPHRSYVPLSSSVSPRVETLSILLLGAAAPHRRSRRGE